MKHFPIILDLIKPQDNKPFFVKNNEANSNLLDITILELEAPYDLTGYIARLVVRNPSGIVNMKDCTLTAPESGLCEVVLEDLMYSEIGEHECEIRLIKEIEEITTQIFTYYSLEAIL
jgi:hypothetical protein